MTPANGICRHSLALLTDLYELTMSNGYWKLGRTDQEAVFHLFFRKHPFSGGYTIACGLEYVVDFLESLRFDGDDVAYLATLVGNDGKPLFEQAFTPGILQVRRYRKEGRFVGDMMYDECTGASDVGLIVDPMDPTRQKAIPEGTAFEDLLVPVFRGGKCVYDRPRQETVRRRAREQLESLHPGIRRFANPHEYPAGLDNRLHELKTQLVLEARGLAV